MREQQAGEGMAAGREADAQRTGQNFGLHARCSTLQPVPAVWPDTCNSGCAVHPWALTPSTSAGAACEPGAPACLGPGSKH